MSCRFNVGNDRFNSYLEPLTQVRFSSPAPHLTHRPNISRDCSFIKRPALQVKVGSISDLALKTEVTVGFGIEQSLLRHYAPDMHMSKFLIRHYMSEKY